MPDFIEVVQRIQSPIENVWAALTEARHLANWQADTASGDLASGNFAFGWPDLGVEAELEVLRVDPRRQLVLSSGRSEVSFQLEPGVLRLRHEGLADDDEAAGVHSSWSVALGVLRHYLAEHFEHDRSVHWAVTPARTTAEATHVFFSEAAALNAWLTRSTTGVGESGSSCRLHFSWGETLTGRVLARSPERDLAFTWSERQDSALILRTLPSPFVPSERILALCWSHWRCPGNDEPTRKQLTAALETLRQVLANTGSA